MKPAEPKKGLVSEEAFALAPEVLRLLGLEDGHPMSIGAAYNGLQLAMKSRGGDPPGTLKSFEKAIARAHAELTRALPVVEIKPGQTIVERPNANTRISGRRSGSLLDSLHDELARLEGNSDREGADRPVLLIPDRSVRGPKGLKASMGMVLEQYTARHSAAFAWSRPASSRLSLEPLMFLADERPPLPRHFSFLEKCCSLSAYDFRTIAAWRGIVSDFQGRVPCLSGGGLDFALRVPTIWL